MEEFYPFAEMQSVYFAAPADRTTVKVVEYDETLLPIVVDALGTIPKNLKKRLGELEIRVKI